MAGPYNPLEEMNLAESIRRALVQSPCVPLPPVTRFPGAGAYALYYIGEFSLYGPLADANVPHCVWPIYIGSAAMPGVRKGQAVITGSRASSLYHRLSQHAGSINQSVNLNLRDFKCRYLVTNPLWLPLVERLMIVRYRPLWNVIVDGFGNHRPGSRREGGRMPEWDALHPGRAWAKGMEPRDSLEALRAKVAAYLGPEGAWHQARSSSEP